MSWAEDQQAMQARVLSQTLPAVQERLDRVDPVLTPEASAVKATITADTTADLVKLREAIDALALLLGDSSTVGSIRATIGNAGDAAGTNTLRALKAQTNANIVTAASIKGLIDQCINLGQRQIDDAQATRRIARQTLRLARQMVGDFSTADVGSDT